MGYYLQQARLWCAGPSELPAPWAGLAGGAAELAGRAARRPAGSGAAAASHVGLPFSPTPTAGSVDCAA